MTDVDLDLHWTAERSAENWQKWFDNDRERDDLLLVAESAGRVVGFVLVGQSEEDDPFKIKVASLQVHPTPQRRGIGSRLLITAAKACLDRGRSVWSIGCVTDKSNIGFYRALGGIEHYRRSALIDRFPTTEIVLAWPDLQGFIQTRKP